MERVGEHPVPVGPLAVRWVAYELAEQRAGVATRARGSGSRTQARRRGARAAGRACSWPTTGSTRSGTRSSGTGTGRASRERSRRARPSSWSRRWSRRGRRAATASRSTSWRSFATGSRSSDPRRSISPSRSGRGSTQRRLAVRVHGAPDPDVDAALAAQAEPIVADDAVAVAHLVPGAIPAPDWSRLLLDAHEEGYGAVGGAIEAESRADRRRYAAWAPGGGRNPRFGEPLLLPSLLDGIRAGDLRGPPRLRGQRRALRGSRRGQTSVAIRSSERLKIHAPTPSATSAATTV